MRTLTLALAAAVLGTGCIVTDGDDRCAPRTITVEWDQFTAGDGARLGCSAAGVAFVDIYMDGTLVESWNCTDRGAAITDVLPGVYTLTIEGVESDGRIAFRDEVTVDSSTCGNRLVRAAPAEGYLELEYAFAPTNVCAATPSYLWFSIYDEVAGAVTAAVDGASSPSARTLYRCPEALVVPLPAGPYTLDWMQEMVLTGPGSFAVAGASCNPTGFSLVGGQGSGLPVVMTDAAAPCL